MDLTDYSERECEKLNKLTGYKSAHITNSRISRPYSEEMAKRIRNDVDFPDNEGTTDSLWHDLLAYGVVLVKSEERKYVAGKSEYFILSELGKNIFRQGGFVKTRENQLARIERKTAVDQAAIEAPRIAREANALSEQAISKADVSNKYALVAVIIALGALLLSAIDTWYDS